MAPGRAWDGRISWSVGAALSTLNKEFAIPRHFQSNWDPKVEIGLYKSFSPDG